ncbi:CHRD domain-containing protein [Pollutibacter soli]|uniref:CHRD domain-containing protein n=1 Tax=Pollutibacter soli TaxID=3034157 RepID=UPI003013E54C
MKTAKQLFFGAITVASLFVMNSCTKDDNDPSNPGGSNPTMVKKWEIPISAAFEIPAPAGRTETGNAVLELWSDNSLRYSINVPSVTAGDSLTMAHLHSGDPVTVGPVILNLAPTFVNGVASDTITGLRQSLADSIETGAVYLNVHSKDFPDGLVRGQLDKTIDFATDVNMTGANVVPAVNTTADGKSYFRLTTDKILYSTTTVNNIEAGDSVTTGALYLGAADANGTLMQQFADSYADFGITKADTLTDEQITQLKSDPVYVTIASKNQANGLVRGQIR